MGSQCVKKRLWKLYVVPTFLSLVLGLPLQCHDVFFYYNTTIPSDFLPVLYLHCRMEALQEEKQVLEVCLLEAQEEAMRAERQRDEALAGLAAAH